MKTDFLKGLNIEGLTDEIITKILAENGKDIEATKTKLDKSQEIENLKNEIKTTKETLDAANVQIKSFEGLDVEGIKKQAEEWKTKYETFETQSKSEKEAYEKKLLDQQRDFKLKEATGKLQFPNKLTEEAFYEKLKAKNLPMENDKFLGFEDYIKEMGEQNPGMFVVETQVDPNAPSYDFSAPTGGQPLADTTMFNFGWNPPTK